MTLLDLQGMETAGGGHGGGGGGGGDHSGISLLVCGGTDSSFSIVLC
jgi:hypothetical protein